MKPRKYQVGKQPCADYSPREADIMVESGHGIANEHDCFGGCEGGTVSFCDACGRDHHSNGWDTCPRDWGTTG